MLSPHRAAKSARRFVGKALRLRETFELKDASGATLATIRKKFLTFTDAMEIEHDGAVVATVHKAVISPLHHRAIIDIAGRGRLEAVGNIIDKDFEIRDGGQVVAQISRAWFRLRDTYGVDVAPRLEVVKTTEPPVRKAGVKVKTVAELIDKLKNEAGAI